MKACNNLPQPNPYILVFEGCGRLLHALTPPRSAFLYLQFWHGVIPTSYFIFILVLYITVLVTGPIRESVDSLCRDGADTPMAPYIGKAFTRTNFEDLSLFRYMIMVCE